MKRKKPSRRKSVINAAFDRAYDLMTVSGLPGPVAFRILGCLIAGGLTAGDVARMFEVPAQRQRIQ